MFVCVCVCVCVCLCVCGADCVMVCVFVCLGVYIYIYIYKSYARVCVCVCACMCVCVCVCLFVVWLVFVQPRTSITMEMSTRMHAAYFFLQGKAKAPLSVTLFLNFKQPSHTTGTGKVNLMLL